MKDLTDEMFERWGHINGIRSVLSKQVNPEMHKKVREQIRDVIMSPIHLQLFQLHGRIHWRGQRFTP